MGVDRHPRPDPQPEALVMMGRPPGYLLEAMAAGAIFVHDDSPLPNEALRERLAAMSPEEKENWVRHHLAFARFYDGPGGP